MNPLFLALEPWAWIGLGVLGLVGLVLFIIVSKYLGLWLQAMLSGAAGPPVASWRQTALGRVPNVSTPRSKSTPKGMRPTGTGSSPSCVRPYAMS